MKINRTQLEQIIKKELHELLKQDKFNVSEQKEESELRELIRKEISLINNSEDNAPLFERHQRAKLPKTMRLVKNLVRTNKKKK